MPVATQELAAALIHVFEGCRLTAYPDSGGVLTIGFGHTGTIDGIPITPGMTITQQQAEALFASDAAPLLALVADRPVPEAAALVSFGYNCGRSRLQAVLAGLDTLGAHVKDHKGNVLPGLVARRNLEELLIQFSLEK